MQRRSFLNSSIWLGFGGVLARPPQQQTRPALVKPRRLRQGDKVALINPAGATAHRMDLEIVQESLEALGLRVKLGEHVMDRRGYLAGSDEDRAADVNRQFEDSSVAGIVAVRGGWGCARILPLLDYQLIGRNPKILVGYSDVTALLLGIHSKTGLVTFHGPVGLGPWNSFTVDHFTRILFEGQAAELSNPKLLGGNLTVLSAIVGSSYLPDWNDAILFLEDTQENIYRVDRMLTQLAFAGIFYEQWTMQHDTQDIYPKLSCKSLAVHMLSKDGRVRTPGGIMPFADALGPQPKNPAALHALLEHPKADKIKGVFDLAELPPEFIGEEDPIPLTDVWPGLEEHLPARRRTCQLIRCERILDSNTELEYVFYDPNIYIVRTGDDDGNRELRLVSNSLDLNLNEHQLKAILHYETQQEIEERRSAVRECSTDAERLLTAVGEQALRQELPYSLLTILKNEGVALTGVQVAEGAIATYHLDALKQYRHALDHLNPPKKWAGSKRAVNFVRSLGFAAEWAGEPNRRRSPFLEIEGPYALPELHDYQKVIVTKVRDMFHNGHLDGAKRRGMISMPTGFGQDACRRAGDRPSDVSR